jgi:hypothetical protein
MNKQITKCAVVIATAGALALGAVAPSWASPVSSSSAVVKESAPSAVSDVRYRGNSGRYYRNNDAGVGLSILGVASAVAGAAAYGQYGNPGYSRQGYYGGGARYGYGRGPSNYGYYNNY